MAIIDCITYNNEAELFDLRYNILRDHVDEFVVCEAPVTFSGKPKPLYFKNIIDKYDKVKYYIIDETDAKLWELAISSPNTVGADHWKREFVHKESIKKALTHLKDEDIVLIGDCDEIWNPEVVLLKKHGDNRLTKLRQYVYTYFLNQRSSEDWHGTLMAKYGDIKGNILNHLRTAWRDVYLPEEYAGWHFTSMHHQVKQKLEDSYTKETYANEWVMDNLDMNVIKSRDFLGRNFTYWVDEFNWPEYLKENKDKYKHLLK